MTSMTPEERQALEDEGVYQALFGSGATPSPVIDTPRGPTTVSALKPGATPEGHVTDDDLLYARLFPTDPTNIYGGRTPA